jgi:hypothetical protein
MHIVFTTHGVCRDVVREVTVQFFYGVTHKYVCEKYKETSDGNKGTFLSYKYINIAVDMRAFEMTSRNFPTLSAYDIGIIT